MMNVMDLFKSAPPAPAPVPANIQGPGTPAPSPSNTPANPPAPTPIPNAPAPAPVDPMAAYTKMWDTPVEAGKAPVYNIDPKIMDDVASKQDFMEGLPPEILAKLQAGDVGAMMQAIKHVGQQSYKAALSHQAILTGKFVEAREGFNEKNVNTRVRGELTNQSLADTPNYANPVVRQQLTETAERLQRQNPDAPPAEIARMTKDYFNRLVSAMAPVASPVPNAKGPVNWDTYFAENQDEASPSP